MPFHTVHAVLKDRILKWFAIPISRDFFKKIRDTKGTFHAKMGTIKETVWTEQKQKILRRGGKNTQNNYTKKIFMTQIIMMV